MRIRYQALGKDGKVMHGILDAETLPLALDALRRQGVIPFVAQPADSKRAGGWLRLGQASKGTSLAWRAQFIQQCATLLAAGIPLDRTLGIIESQAPAGHRKRLLGNIRDAVNAGQSLSAALAIGEAGFQPDETGLVKAGEQTGSLVPVLVDLGAALERRQELRGRIISTLIYPAFLLGLAPLSLAIISVILIPSLEPLFEGSHASMPLVLRLLSAVSTELHERAVLWLAAALLLVMLATLAWRGDETRATTQRLVLKLPIFRNIARHVEAARICRSLAALLKGGASLQSALAAVAGVAVTTDSRNQITMARDAVVSGKRLAQAMSHVRALRPETIEMIAIGEETNQLEPLLSHIAEAEQKAGERYVERLMTIATPLLTILVGGMVGGVVMSIMSAILSLNDMAVR
jgi:general secretion pathway protein F